MRLLDIKGNEIHGGDKLVLVSEEDCEEDGTYCTLHVGDIVQVKDVDDDGTFTSYEAKGIDGWSYWLYGKFFELVEDRFEEIVSWEGVNFFGDT